MSKAKAFLRDRVAACRSLDETVFQKFMDDWKAPQPRAWLPKARLIMMHKIRVQPGILGFTDEERQVSRDWLADNGYDDSGKNDGKPCPECGSTTDKPTFSNCSTCGRAQ